MSCHLTFQKCWKHEDNCKGSNARSQERHDEGPELIFAVDQMILGQAAEEITKTVEQTSRQKNRFQQRILSVYVNARVKQYKVNSKI